MTERVAADILRAELKRAGDWCESGTVQQRKSLPSRRVKGNLASAGFSAVIRKTYHKVRVVRRNASVFSVFPDLPGFFYLVKREKIRSKDFTEAKIVYISMAINL